ncbi:GNAT family N-acetyltransferase [Nocardia sp. XZ_19_369]|uniref:GNAT family N-acetyltransferase n=1 Tax=Nocardia sp. XZ_19_369 TaxID=2769487 RepID=UPI0035A2A4AA
MLHNGYDYDYGLECHGVFLWRLMVAGPYQGLGVGRRAIEMIVESLKARGISELYAGCGQGPSSPGPFYEKLGFVPSGVFYGDDDEIGICFAGSPLSVIPMTRSPCHPPWTVSTTGRPSQSSANVAPRAESSTTISGRRRLHRTEAVTMDRAR